MNGCDFIGGVVFLYCEMVHADIRSHIYTKEYIIDYWSWHACYWLSPVSQPSPINHFYNSKITTIAVIVVFCYCCWFQFRQQLQQIFELNVNNKYIYIYMTTGNKCKYLWTKSQNEKKPTEIILSINKNGYGTIERKSTWKFNCRWYVFCSSNESRFFCQYE